MQQRREAAMKNTLLPSHHPYVAAVKRAGGFRHLGCLKADGWVEACAAAIKSAGGLGKGFWTRVSSTCKHDAYTQAPLHCRHF
eukprot:1162083-Pelagomonas_calceolata.AAC.9